MNKSVIVLSLMAATALSACQKESSPMRPPQSPIVDDFNQPNENTPPCHDRVITSYNRVINQANRFAWSGHTRNLRNLVAACGELRALLRQNSCLATDLSTGQLMAVSFNDLKPVCDQANYYNNSYDRNRTGYSSKPGQDRQENFDLGRMRDKEGIGKPSEPRSPKRPTPPRGPSGPSGR